MNAPLALYSAPPGGIGGAGSSHNRPLISTARTAPASTSWPNDFVHTEFSFEPYVKSQLGVKLDNDAQICPDFAERLACPRGASCPRRHVRPSQLNFLPPGSTALRDPNKRTVCKHWLRGLCKKGEQCDYLHEYDMRRIPECRFYATFGFCNSGDDCLYLHVDKSIKRRECERYNRGFCPKGPLCPKKHIRRVACPYYLAGFCPEGRECKLGHIKSTPPSQASRSNSPVLTHRPLTAAEAFGMGGGAGRADDGGEGGGMRRERAQPGRYGMMGGGGGGGASGGPAANGGPPAGGPMGAFGGANRSGGVGPAGGAMGSGMASQHQGGQGAGGRGWKKDLSEVLCFKCGEYGHFANMCPNPNRPGNRGGMERGPGGQTRPGLRPRPY
ncbi:hypothetical protein BCV70DRAFT_197785 [Testicularia cyperi]|uniref:mRNA 3'-end-processing protein n=1 Tax=Testicularia cyperi TaxID=1882483 RepID=A0A317Y0J3_9BASI|nr:hypothetical protein BCV70DRAFT_197785 [Testicularia cyperi]